MVSLFKCVHNEYAAQWSLNRSLIPVSFTEKYQTFKSCFSFCKAEVFFSSLAMLVSDIAGEHHLNFSCHDLSLTLVSIFSQSSASLVQTHTLSAPATATLSAPPGQQHSSLPGFPTSPQPTPPQPALQLCQQQQQHPQMAQEVSESHGHEAQEACP